MKVTDNGELYYGDNLVIMQELLDKGVKADLIYIDPPFGIPADKQFGMEAWKKTDYYDERVYNRFKDILNENDLKFLSFLYPRLYLMRELLSETGSIYVHIDWHVGHYVKILLDEIFGKGNFRNEIVWKYTGGLAPGKDFNRKHDNIYRYSKGDIYFFKKQFEKYSDASIKRFNLKDDIGFYKSTIKDGKEYKTYMKEGKSLEDTWIYEDNEDDIIEQNIVVSTHGEHVNYGTQKPEKLLQRIIDASCPEGGIVCDFFGGSGTTGAVAEKLNRKWILVDNNEKAIETIKKRLGTKK